MFEKVEVPVLGIVENMSVHICSHCGHHEPIFGTGGAEKLAQQYHTQLLGQLPLHITLREDLDKGTPTVVSRPDSEFTALYRQLAGRVAAQLYWQGEVILWRYRFPRRVKNRGLMAFSESGPEILIGCRQGKSGRRRSPRQHIVHQQIVPLR